MTLPFDADIKLNCDYLIIGAGTVGLPLATWLAEENLGTVLCLDGGPKNSKYDADLYGELILAGSDYCGGRKGRSYGLGGTSAIWGGALVEFQAADIDRSHWEVSSRDLSENSDGVKKFFQICDENTNCATEDFKEKSYFKRCADWPNFKRRNTYNIFRKKQRILKNIGIQCDAVVTKIVERTHYVTVNYKKLDSFHSVNAKNVIICAGAIETTRLALQAYVDNKKSAPGDLGHFFCDHLSARVGVFCPSSANRLNKKLYLKKMKGGSFRSPRFEMTSLSRLRSQLPPHFFHISFESDGIKNSAFSSVRNILKCLQKRQIPNLNDFINIIKNLSWFLNFLISYVFFNYILREKSSKAYLNIVIEQLPQKHNKLTISEKEFDRHGRPLAILDWKISQNDFQNIKLATIAFKDFWDKELALDFGYFETSLQDIGNDKDNNIYDIFHPSGTVSFKDSIRTQPALDRNLYLKGFNRIQCLSTATLPTGGGGNPTFTVLQLAHRCAQFHKKRGILDRHAKE